MKNPLVLDTNIVLDLFVFADERVRPLKQLLETGEVQWLATAPMRDELQCVLAYPHIEAKLGCYALQAGEVLAAFDRHVTLVDVAVKAPVTCKDGDDQKFIDLAHAHRCPLLSKDLAVLALKKRLQALGVTVATALAASSYRLSES